jgi:predicted metal-dependent peptidase
MMDKQEERLRKSHVYLLKNPKTCSLGGIILMGASEVKDDVPTAYTDGKNKRYGRKFLSKCTDAQVNGLVMHENGHVFFRHVTHHRRLFKENAKMANIAADFVVNSMIVELNDPNIELPPGALYNEMFRNWSVIQVYDYLKKKCKEKSDSGSSNDNKDQDGDESQNQDNDSPSPETKNKQTDVDNLCKNLNDYDSLDEHDHAEAEKHDQKKAGEEIDRALREGGLLAGILGGNKNRQIDEMLQVGVDWKEAFREFILSCCIGKDDYTYRKFNMRHLANDMYLPSTHTDTVREIVVAIDTSGSIGQDELSEFAGELASICETVTPEKVRILWWDTKVHGEQTFASNYSNLRSLLKPVGGGGTRISCVSEYLVSKSINAECVVLFTDGYVEQDVKWTHSAPLLWLITRNRDYVPSVGKKIPVDAVFA